MTCCRKSQLHRNAVIIQNKKDPALAETAIKLLAIILAAMILAGGCAKSIFD